MLTASEAADLAHPKAWDSVGELDVVAPYSIAMILAASLSASGYRQHEDDREGTLSVLVLRPEQTPERVPLARFREIVAASAADSLGAALALLKDEHPRRGRQRIATTRDVLLGERRGAVSYVRNLAEFVRDVLPQASAEDLAAAVSEARARRAAERAAPADYAANRREASALASASARATFLLWALSLPEGDHDLAEVWQAWERALSAADERTRRRTPDLFRSGAFGRTRAYAALAEVWPVVPSRSAAARRRIRVDYWSRTRALLIEGSPRAKLAALRGQRARLAAEASAS